MAQLPSVEGTEKLRPPLLSVIADFLSHTSYPSISVRIASVFGLGAWCNMPPYDDRSKAFLGLGGR